MATRTPSRSSSSRSSSSTSTKNRGNPDQPRKQDGEFKARSRKSPNSSSNRQDRSAFSWGDNAGPLIGVALAGAAFGFAANFGRKLLMQGIEATAGDWDQILSAEHAMAMAIFDKMLATDQSQAFKRKMLLMKLTHALDKHAHHEEMVVYPALREANEKADADHLEGEHGYIKTFIYELTKMGPESPNWLERVRQFRDLVHQHAQMEEEQVFPRFKQAMTAEQNGRITSLVNRDGFWMA